MAQTGYTPILLYSSSTTTNAPTAGNLTNSTFGSELAINIADGKLFYKDPSNNVQVIAWKTTPTTAGGTGLTSYTAGDLTYYASGTTLTKLTIGSSGQVLTSSGTAPQWTTLSGVAVTTFSAGTTGFTPNSATSGAITLAGTLITSNGGTGLSSYTAGDLTYYASGTTLTKLAIGASTTILTSSGTAPQWSAASGVTVGTATNLAGGVAGSVPYQTAAGTTAMLAIGVSGRWLGSSGTAPQWNAPAALTKTDDTNVTLTLGGSASTALLNAASLTLGWTGTLAVSRGGTGTGTAFTAGSVVFAGASGVYSQDNSNLFWDNTNKFLGIGTAAPAYSMHIVRAGADAQLAVQSSSSGAALIRMFASTQGLASFNSFQSLYGSTVSWSIGGNGSNDTIAFNTAGSERMRIFSSGGVSIGNTTDPGATNLSVNGSAYIGNTTTSAAAERFNVNGFGGFGDRTATNPFILIGNTGSGNGVIGTFSNHALEIRTNNSNIATFTTGGGFTCVGVYNTTVGATNRDVFVDNAGVVGYVSSTRESKTNIENLTDTSWLYQLNPVTFNYRKRDENGQYTNDIDGDIQYGLIAEDVEQIRSDLCFYDETENGYELRGIQYSKLVPVMLKAIQELNAEIKAMKGAK